MSQLSRLNSLKKINGFYPLHFAPSFIYLSSLQVTTSHNSTNLTYSYCIHSLLNIRDKRAIFHYHPPLLHRTEEEKKGEDVVCKV